MRQSRALCGILTAALLNPAIATRAKGERKAAGNISWASYRLAVNTTATIAVTARPQAYSLRQYCAQEYHPHLGSQQSPALDSLHAKDATPDKAHDWYSFPHHSPRYQQTDSQDESWQSGRYLPTASPPASDLLNLENH